MERVLVDAGPLVALVSARDQYHDVCVDQFRSWPPPLLTTWAVLAEAAWIVRTDEEAQQGLLTAGILGIYQLVHLDQIALPWLAEFLHRYRSLKAQLADATLVYLAEQQDINTIFTLDRRDFSVYRFGRNRAFKILPEI